VLRQNLIGVSFVSTRPPGAVGGVSRVMAP
jgi:hypothetical protein